MNDCHAPQSFPVFDSVVGWPQDVLVSAQARTLYVAGDEKVYAAVMPAEAFGARDEMLFAATMAIVVEMLESAIWKMFGKDVAVPVPMLVTVAENEVGGLEAVVGHG